jgi:hypothetical protein
LTGHGNFALSIDFSCVSLDWRGGSQGLLDLLSDGKGGSRKVDGLFPKNVLNEDPVVGTIPPTKE